MKLIKKLLCMSAVAAMAFVAGRAAAQPIIGHTFPLVPLNISGTFFYNTNDVIDTNTVKVKTQTISFTSKDLMKLLMTSSQVSNAVVAETTSNGIPAGSYLVFDLNNFIEFGEGDIIVSNKTGFSFDLGDFANIVPYDSSEPDFFEEPIFIQSFNPLLINPAKDKLNIVALCEFTFSDKLGDIHNPNVNAFEVQGGVLITATENGNPTAPATMATSFSFSFNDTGSARFNTFDGVANVSGNATK